LEERPDNRCEHGQVKRRSRSGGLEVVAEGRTYGLPAGAVHTLLALGRSVRLTEGGVETNRALAWPGPDRRWICFKVDGVPYRIPCIRLLWVARGDISSDRLFRAVMP
jgi:hypothetical protein